MTPVLKYFMVLIIMHMCTTGWNNENKEGSMGYHQTTILHGFLLLFAKVCHATTVRLWVLYLKRDTIL